MDKKKKELVRYVPSYRDSDGTLYEMLRTTTQKAVYLCQTPEGEQSEVQQVRTGTGELLKPLPVNSPLLVHDIVRLPEKCGKSGTVDDLFVLIERFLRQWVCLRDSEYVITTYYILMTWVFDTFNEVPYLRVRGDFGTGKTRFLTVVGSLCNKAIFTSGASTVAPLFHLLHQIHGTLILDEADFRYSSETAEITKILNNGNASGFPVLRCQKTAQGKFETVAYTVFGPKIIASRKQYEDEALESRCISFDMGYHKEGMGEVPLSLPGDFGEISTDVQNELLAFRCGYGKSASKINVTTLDGVSHRLQQVYGPLLQLCARKEHQELIVMFAQESHAQQLADRGLSTESEVLNVMWEYYAVEKKSLPITELCTRFKKKYGSRYDHTITPKWIGGIVRGKLLLSTRKSNGRYVICENQKEKIVALWERFDV